MPNLPALFASSDSGGQPWGRRIALCLLGWCLAASVGAQTYSIRDYAQADGLQGMTVNSLLEDRQGVVWVGTELGLHRFERERFIPVGRESGLDARFIRALTLDRRGRLWVASVNGVFVRNGTTFTPVLQDGNPIRAENGNVIAPYADGVVVVSENQLLQVSPAQPGGWSVRPLPLRLDDGTTLPAGKALLADGQVLWASCGKQVCRIDDAGRIVLLGDADGVPERQWRAIFRDHRGTLWLRGGGLVLSRAPGQHLFRDHPAPAGTRFDTLSAATTLSEDAQGRLITRSDRGMVRWEGDRWRYFGHDQGSGVSPMVGPLLMQSTGQLWIGTRGLGVQRWLGYGTIEHWDESQGLAEAPTWSIQRLPSGELLVGGDAGSNLFDPRTGRVQPWTLANGEPLLQAVSIALSPADGAAWVGRSSGALARRDPGTGKTIDVLQLGLPISKLLFDPAGVLWISTPHGLYSIQPGTPPHPARELSVPAVYVADLDLDHQGRLWAGTREGLYRREADGRWVRVQVHGDLPTQQFFLLDFSTDGQLWVSLRDTGLWHGKVQDAAQITLSAVADPLVSRVMPFILRHDSKGRLWLGSSQGLDLLDRGRWSRATRSEGLLWDDVSANALFEDGDGSIWLGSSRGLSHLIDPSRVFAAPPLRVEVLRVRRGEQTIAPGARVPWSQVPLDVDIGTPGVEGGPDRISFRYRAKGHQAGWTTTSLSHLSYPLLPPGRYSLEIQAVDASQRSISPITRFDFVLTPPWWRAPAALIAYGLLAVAGVVALLRWRTAKLLRRKRELEHLVAERTAELEQDKRELEAARAELTLKASHDELTGLLNRAGILAALRCLLQRADPPTRPLAVVLIDLDHFKQVNDQHGHLAGDAVLAGVGRRLDALVRGDDRVGRYGGEELLALLPGLQCGATHRLEDLHRGICGDYRIDGASLHITCSAGVAWLQPAETLEHLLARADAALYRAKRDGRNRIAYADQTPLTGAPASDDR
ncbi:diguanylate cyclase [Xanthomonas melonis]|uniref:diguanylate cyclase n=1 Tax=Xanthomonas melonis TaxID=56456 RepID=A0ABS8NS23_9XANT|nr:diguanylate cyclase [Xanthomonas melonis]MCD0245106.1 diguanylate cyclase [Xanthomonas melonis]MCD0257613.1 diguanylate cyclase [Xanthomonas melonis]MCD0265874.1 diguanylate cyclase [Xanthomonas melonis]